MYDRAHRSWLASLGFAVVASCSKPSDTAPAPTASAPSAPITSAKTSVTALTAEELRLIDADPKTLTVEDRRARGHALRKRVMQNPDSAAARSLRKAEQGLLDGTIAPPTPSGAAQTATPPVTALP